MAKNKDAGILGVVTEALPNTFFRVILEGKDKEPREGQTSSEGGEEILTYLAGKMRMHHIRILVGDKVKVEIDPYGGKGRIVQRL